MGNALLTCQEKLWPLSTRKPRLFVDGNLFLQRSTGISLANIYMHIHLSSQLQFYQSLTKVCPLDTHQGYGDVAQGLPPELTPRGYH